VGLYSIDFLSRVGLELGNDAGEMRPHGQKSWLTSHARQSREGSAPVHFDHIMSYNNILPYFTIQKASIKWKQRDVAHTKVLE
jgi:hypothetical protein